MCRTQNDAIRCHTLPNEPPQGNQKPVAAVGCGSTVDFYHTDIAGGTWDKDTNQWVGSGALNADGGTIFVSCNSKLLGNINVNISDDELAHFADVINQNAAVTVTFTSYIDQCRRAGSNPTAAPCWSKTPWTVVIPATP